MTRTTSTAMYRLAINAGYLLALTVPFQLYLPIGGFPLATSYVLIGIIFGGWLFDLLLRRDGRVIVPKVALPFAVLIVLIFASTVVAADRQAVLNSAVQVTAYFLLFLSMTNLLRSSRQVIKSVRLLLWGLITSACLGIVQAIAGTLAAKQVIALFFASPLATFTLGLRGLQRIGDLEALTVLRSSSLAAAGDIFRGFGFFTGPTIYGWFMVTGVAFAAGIWLSAATDLPRLRGLARWCTLLTTVAVFVSWTRSAWIACLFALLFAFIFRRARSTGLVAKRWWRMAVLLLGLGGALVGVGLLLPNTAIGQMILTSSGLADASSNRGRLGTMLFAFEWMTHHPFLGAGFRNYAYVASGGTLFASQVATEAAAHNTYLELGVELGVVGLGVFLWLLVALFQGARRLIRRPRYDFAHALGVATGATWLTFALLCLFAGSIVEPRWMPLLWLIASLQGAMLHFIQLPVQPAASTHWAEGGAAGVLLGSGR